MASACGDAEDGIQAAYHSRRVAGDIGAVAELAEPIAPPTIRCSVGEGGACVVSACGDAGDVGEAGHRYRNVAGGGGAVAELTVAVVAPTVCGSVGEDGAGVVVTCGDVSNAGQATHQDRYQTVGGGAVTELAVRVASPTFHSLIIKKSAGMVVAYGNLEDASATGSFEALLRGVASIPAKSAVLVVGGCVDARSVAIGLSLATQQHTGSLIADLAAGAGSCTTAAGEGIVGQVAAGSAAIG